MAYCTHNEYMDSLIKEFVNFEDPVREESHDYSRVPPWGELKGALSELPSKVDEVAARYPEASLTRDNCDILKQDHKAMLSRYPDQLEIKTDGKDAPFVHGPGLTIGKDPVALILAPSAMKQFSAHGMAYSIRFKRLHMKNGKLACVSKAFEKATDVSAPWGMPKKFEAIGAPGAYKRDLGGREVPADSYKLFMVQVFCHLAKYDSLEAASAYFEPTVSTTVHGPAELNGVGELPECDENMGIGKRKAKVDAIGKITSSEASASGRKTNKWKDTESPESDDSSATSQGTTSPTLKLRNNLDHHCDDYNSETETSVSDPSERSLTDTDRSGSNSSEI